MPPHRQHLPKRTPTTIHHHHHHHHQHTHHTTKTYINGALTLTLPPPPLPKKRLTLHISAYTARPDLPPSTRLTVYIPRGTSTVVQLAERIDAAYELPRTIDWARMIAECGVRVGGWDVRTDGDVCAWMLRGEEEEEEEEEEAWLCG